MNALGLERRIVRLGVIAAVSVGVAVSATSGGVTLEGMAATIYNAHDGQSQVERDGYGRARETLAELRPLAGAATAPKQAPSRYRPGDRVEINVDGTWYAASVANVSDDRYRIQRDDHSFGVSSTEEWVSADRLRPLAANAVAAPLVSGLPKAVPAGLYSCTLFGSGNTAGKLRILDGTTSSGVTPDGAGPQHQFTYDPASGAMSWIGGLQIFSWTVEQALYGPDGKGIPNITLHYRLRAGGNLNSMGCKRE
jgi:hypothetical protein